MNHETFREKLWQAFFAADFNVRYWKLYETRVGWADKAVRAFLALASVLSAVAFLSGPIYQYFATLVAVFSGLISTVVIPAFALDGYLQKTIGIRNRWIDVRIAYESIWDEIDCQPDLELQIKAFNRVLKIDKELEQGGNFFHSKKLREIAMKESKDHLLPSG